MCTVCSYTWRPVINGRHVFVDWSWFLFRQVPHWPRVQCFTWRTYPTCLPRAGIIGRLTPPGFVRRFWRSDICSLCLSGKDSTKSSPKPWTDFLSLKKKKNGRTYCLLIIKCLPFPCCFFWGCKKQPRLASNLGPYWVRVPSTQITGVSIHTQFSFTLKSFYYLYLLI